MNKNNKKSSSSRRFHKTKWALWLLICMGCCVSCSNDNDSDTANDDLNCSSDQDCALRTDGKTKCNIPLRSCEEPVAQKPQCTSDADCIIRIDGKTKCNLSLQVCEGSLPIEPYCGDGTINGDEDCEAQDLNGMRCADLDGFSDGVLACNALCRFDTSGCFECSDDAHCAGKPETPSCKAHVCVPKCGNGKLDNGEDCDDKLYKNNKVTCAEWHNDYNLGNVSCKSDCTIDYSACKYEAVSTCNNNQLDGEEVCDGTLFKDNKLLCSEYNDEYNTGSVTCNACSIDYSDCRYCLTLGDEAVRNYALAHWDKDKDGCFSREEAAAVTTIPEKAFMESDIRSLDDFKLFPNLTTIEYGAFFKCLNLTSVELPQVKQIGDYAFQACLNLRSIEFLAVTKIGEGAFLKSGLTSMNLPEVTTIRRGAFQETKLVTVSLPKATWVEGGLFQECPELVAADMPLVESFNGASVFADSVKLQSVRLPKLTRLPDYMFMNCTSLTTVEVPEVTSIDQWVFYNCPSLTSLDLPKVNRLSQDSFSGEVNLTSISLTTSDDIQLGSAPEIMVRVFPAESCTLTLNENKKFGGSSKPSVDEDGVTWVGAKWKEIKFVSAE